MKPRDMLENHARGLRYIANLQYLKSMQFTGGLVNLANYRSAGISRARFEVFTRDEASYIFSLEVKDIYVGSNQRKYVGKLQEKNKHWIVEHEVVCKQIYAYDRGEYKVSHTDIMTNINMLERRLHDIELELSSLNAQFALAKKENSQPSPGLNQAISSLREKQSNFIESLELWRTMKVVYPNYDR